MNYQILVNRDNKIDDVYYKKVIKPALVAVKTIKNNDIVYSTFGIDDHTTYLERTTAEAFKNLQKSAIEHGIILDITSGYLSFEQQQKKYDYFVSRHGEEWAKKSACLPGYSEHNTGLAIDCDIFRNNKWGGIALDKNGNTNPMVETLHTLLHKHGFILRYPKGKEKITNMKFEPWHIRYVGKELATYLYTHKLTLEEYFNNEQERSDSI